MRMWEVPECNDTPVDLVPGGSGKGMWSDGRSWRRAVKVGKTYNPGEDGHVGSSWGSDIGRA
jgi:hypothetical protein